MTKQTILIVIILIFSCKFEKKDTITLSDSISIFNSCLDSKSFLKGNIQYSDTLYIIKNKNYHKNYPTKSSYFKLYYIENVEKNKTFNLPNRYVDKRERYEITDFSKKKDTIYISFYNHGLREGFNFSFLKKKGSWTLVRERNLLN
ncbi:hypothetical protein [Pedobacter nototheniae]|uniref:hypothetical protein n=1 Tax=Pedobacter nototheniae TaxID=2488994 RepID=UPI00292EB331|nr:hypothetical protein [Pedobacter nototheniae]